MTKGIIPFSCIKDLGETVRLFREIGYIVTVVETKRYIRVERIDEDA